MPTTTFVADRDKTVTITAEEIVASTVTLSEGLNIEKIEVNGTSVTNLPYDLVVPNGSIQEVAMYGKPDPTITINYTNTEPPIVTNT